MYTLCSLYERYYILHTSTVVYTMGNISRACICASIQRYIHDFIYFLRFVNVSCLYQLMLRVPFDTA